MAKQAQYPFLDIDISKIMDVQKMMAEYKIPGVDVENILAAQRRNIEAVTAANQLALEGMQAVMRRQSEILRQSMEQATSMVGEMMSAGTPEDKVAKQAELVKLSFERALANMKELAEMVAKSNTEAAEVISRRVSDSLDEIRTAVQKAPAGK